MTRLTRQETQARTREELLATACEHFLEKGYAAASVEQIAEEAGYSKGAVYSNFTNKDELCLEVLNQIRAKKVTEISFAIEEGRSFEDSLAVFRDWADRTIGDRRWTLLEIEFSARSRHDEHIRNAIAEGTTRVRQLIARLVQSLARRHELKPALAPDATATLLLSTGIGLGLQRAIDPGLPVDAIVDAMRAALLR